MTYIYCLISLVNFIKILDIHKPYVFCLQLCFMNCFKTNEPFSLVVENFCSQQIIFTKKKIKSTLKKMYLLPA